MVGVSPARRCADPDCTGGPTILSAYNAGEVCGPCDARRSKAILDAAELVPASTPKPTGNQSGLCLCGCGERTEIAKRTRSGAGLLAGAPRFYVQGHQRRGALIGRRGSLTAAAARQIRERHDGGESVAAMARAYGVSRTTVRDVLAGRSWREA